jgi:hypothetical protein
MRMLYAVLVSKQKVSKNIFFTFLKFFFLAVAIFVGLTIIGVVVILLSSDALREMDTEFTSESSHKAFDDLAGSAENLSKEQVERRLGPPFGKFVLQNDPQNIHNTLKSTGCTEGQANCTSMSLRTLLAVITTRFFSTKMGNSCPLICKFFDCPTFFPSFCYNQTLI